MNFPMYLKTDKKLYTVEGILDSTKKPIDEYYIDNSGYVDERGDVWIFRDSKKDIVRVIPAIYFNEDGILCFNDPDADAVKQFKDTNLVAINEKTISDTTQPDDQLFDADMIEAMNSAVECFAPELYLEDEFMSKIVKIAILKKALNVARLKNKMAEPYVLPNMKAALSGNTKMSVPYFLNWMEILGLDFELIIRDNGQDQEDPLPYTVTYKSATDKMYINDEEELVLELKERPITEREIRRKNAAKKK